MDNTTSMSLTASEKRAILRAYDTDTTVHTPFQDGQPLYGWPEREYAQITIARDDADAVSIPAATLETWRAEALYPNTKVLTDAQTESCRRAEAALLALETEMLRAKLGNVASGTCDQLWSQVSARFGFDVAQGITDQARAAIFG